VGEAGVFIIVRSVKFEGGGVESIEEGFLNRPEEGFGGGGTKREKKPLRTDGGGRRSMGRGGGGLGVCKKGSFF